MPFLSSTASRLDLAAAPAADAKAILALPGDRRAQVNPNWCWAAAAALIAQQYGNGAGPTQETIAAAVPASAEGTASITDALQAVGHLAYPPPTLPYRTDDGKAAGVVDFETLAAQIRISRAVVLQVFRRLSSGEEKYHDLVVYGFTQAPGHALLYLFDPDPTHLASYVRTPPVPPLGLLLKVDASGLPSGPLPLGNPTRLLTNDLWCYTIFTQPTAAVLA